MEALVGPRLAHQDKKAESHGKRTQRGKKAKKDKAFCFPRSTDDYHDFRQQMSENTPLRACLSKDVNREGALMICVDTSVWVKWLRGLWPPFVILQSVTASLAFIFSIFISRFILVINFYRMIIYIHFR